MSNGRPDRDEVLMSVATLFATRSTCSRLHVGAVFSKEGRILVTGYNGAPAGLPHCDHSCNCTSFPVEVEELPSRGKAMPPLFHLKTAWFDGIPHDERCAVFQPCLISEHAERNAIAFAARNGVALEGSEVHVTHMPCLPCAMSMVNAGVVAVHYREDYRIRDGLELLKTAGVAISQDFGKVVI